MFSTVNKPWQRYLSLYLAIIEWGWVGYEEFCRSRLKAEVDNTLRDLQNSSYPTKAEFNNCFISHSKYFLLLKGVSPLRSLFSRSTVQSFVAGCTFDVILTIIFGGLHVWRHWFNMAKILSKFGEQQLVMVNYVCGFHQSETGKYFEWIIIDIVVSVVCTLIDREQYGSSQWSKSVMKPFPNQTHRQSSRRPFSKFVLRSNHLASGDYSGIWRHSRPVRARGFL